MFKKLASIFQRYEFDDEDFLNACCFTELQQAYITNEIAIIAEENVTLHSDAIDDKDFRMKHMYNKGRIEALKYLLEVSNIKMEELAALHEKKRRSQSDDVDE